jgi:hypothetical protein
MSLSEKPPLPNPIPEKDPELPWWLTDPHPRPASALWQPEKPHDPLQLASPAPDFQSYTPLIRSWDSVSGGSAAPVYQPPSQEVRPLDHQDNHDGEVSRLGGLRSMLFPMGLKDLSKTNEPPAPEPPPLRSIQADPGLAVVPRPIAPFPEYSMGLRPTHVAEDPQGGSSRQPIPISIAPVRPNPPSVPQMHVVAQPEFLPPPREFVVKEDTGRLRKTSGAHNSDRRDAYDDDVHTLPSRRGQYKRRD